MKLSDLIDTVNSVNTIYRVLDVVPNTSAKEFTARLRTVSEWNGGKGIDEREALLEAIKKLLLVSEHIQDTKLTLERPER